MDVGTALDEMDETSGGRVCSLDPVDDDAEPRLAVTISETPFRVAGGVYGMVVEVEENNE